MIKTVEAVVDEHGKVILAEHFELSCPRRALVTILDEEPTAPTLEPSLLSEQTLAEDWNRPKKMLRGRTCKRIGSRRAVSVFRSLASETSPGDRNSRGWQRGLDSLPSDKQTLRRRSLHRDHGAGL